MERVVRAQEDHAGNRGRDAEHPGDAERIPPAFRAVVAEEFEPPAGPVLPEQVRVAVAVVEPLPGQPPERVAVEVRHPGGGLEPELVIRARHANAEIDVLSGGATGVEAPRRPERVPPERRVGRREERVEDAHAAAREVPAPVAALRDVDDHAASSSGRPIRMSVSSTQNSSTSPPTRLSDRISPPTAPI